MYVSPSLRRTEIFVLVPGDPGVSGQRSGWRHLFLSGLKSANSPATRRSFDRIVQRPELAQAKSSMETRREHGHSSGQHQICEVGAPASGSR